MKVVMQETDIEMALERICLQILEQKRESKQLAIVGIHTCGVYLAKALQELLVTKLPETQIDFGILDINLYRDDWSLISQNPVVKKSSITFKMDQADVILVDDVIFSGRTVRAAMDALFDYGRPQSIQLAALIDRGGRELPIQADYVGTRISPAADEHIQVIVNDEKKCTKVVVQ